MTAPMRPWSDMDVPLPVLEQQIAATQFEQAAERTASPSDRIAFHLDAWLVTHPAVCATADDYPEWPAQFAAIRIAHTTAEETP